MKRIYKMLLVGVAVISCYMMFVIGNACAQPVVEIVVTPDIQEITLGAGLTEILLMAQLDDPQAECVWSLDGPGQFTGDPTDQGLFYIPPEEIKEPTARVTIVVIVTDKEGNKATKSRVFTLKSPTPTPIPSPTSTPFPPGIHDMVIKGEQGTIMNPTYEIKPGETITIEVKITSPPDRKLKVDCTAIRGKVEVDQGKITYTAPNKLGGKDMLTVKAVDSDTGKAIVQKVIKIQIKD